MRIPPGFIREARKQTGIRPGSLIHIGERKADTVHIRLLSYDTTELREQQFENIDDALAHIDPGKVNWLNIDGLHEVDVIRRVGEQFHLDPLMLEDILDTEQNPKMEAYPEHLFFVLDMFILERKQQRIDLEQFSMVLGPHYVLTFQERNGDVLDPIRARCRQADSRLRQAGTALLTYAIIDALAESSISALDTIAEAIERLEVRLFRELDRMNVEELYSLQVELIYLRRAAYPLRDILLKLDKVEHPVLKRTRAAYLRDILDQAVQTNDRIDTYRDILRGMLDLYHSSVSTRMNGVITVLTIISTIFIPLTFISSIYGMNFKHMPELDEPWAYPAIWGVMVSIAVGMLIYFKRKGWI